MKMNKLAAGALALALGLGAVAPAVAAETKDYTGAQLFLEKYEKQLKDVNALRRKAIAAQEKIDAASKRLDDAKARVEAADKAYKAKFPYAIYKEGGTVYTPQELNRMTLEREYKALNVAYGWANSIGAGDEKNIASHIAEYKTVINTKDKSAKDARDAVEALIKDKYENGQGTVASDVEKQNKISAYVVAVEEYYLNSLETSEAQQLYNELVAALAERTAAQTNYDTVYNNNIGTVNKYNKALSDLTEQAKGYGYVVQIGNNGLKLVKDGEAKVESPKKFNIEQLKAARAKALTTLDAVKLLEELAPQKIAGVKAELNKLVEEQKALIKLADKYLAKEMALVSTAYAAEDEEEMSPEELTNKLNEKSDKIQDLIKDKEEDKKPEEKPEDKKPEEEKKPEENKPAKKSGNNARTGIAGVAGVAGILAAASVAYAASKRD